jgi:dTDP-4-amino-4,6-dideoxygalactose transaminase
VNVAFLDLSRQTAQLRDELDEAYARVAASGHFVLEAEVERLEVAWASFCGTRFAVGVASGTDAIALALAALGVGPGDQVVTAANTCVPTIVGIEATGATPVLADADAETRTLDPARLEEALSSRTRAIVPVHLYGGCADVDTISAVAGGIPIVEDCAQAHGAELGGRRAGSLGAAGAWSFYPTKNLGALGDAGAVTTDDPGVADRVRLLRRYGERKRYRHVLRGRNSRLDALQAAFLSAKLPHLEAWNERRRAVAGHYAQALEGTALEPPAERRGQRHVFHLYTVLARDRDAVRSALADRGVQTAIHFPRPVHRQPAYEALTPEGRSLATSEALCASVLSVPLYPELTDGEVEHVARSLREVAARALSPART